MHNSGCSYQLKQTQKEKFCIVQGYRNSLIKSIDKKLVLCANKQCDARIRKVLKAQNNVRVILM